MPNHTYHASKAPGVVQRARNTKAGRKLERGGYLTPATVTMWVAFAAAVVLNGLIEGGRLGGVSSADVTFQVFTWFTPAPYAFAIWSVVYIGLAVWLVAYTRDAQMRARTKATVPPLFVASCALNALWLAVFHFQQIIPALAIIVVLWAVVAALYLACRRAASTGFEWVPMSLYASWLTVATVTNAANLFTRMLGGGIPVLNELSAIVLSAAALALGYLMKKAFDDGVAQLVFLWAVVAVGVNVAPANALVALVVFALAVAGGVLTYAKPSSLRHLRRMAQG